MTVPAANHPAAVFHSAQVVGNAFVGQYYHVLCNSPESVYKFYNDSSILSRPNSDGTMTSVTTGKAIDEKIQSLYSKNFKPEIETVDAQESYQAGVIVVVTGSLIEADDVKRKFSQTFFLAPQEKGYFVLNDVFRYVEESGQLEINSKPVGCDGDSCPSAPLISVSEPTSVLPSHAFDPSNTLESEDSKDQGNRGEICSPLDNNKHSVMAQEIVNEQPTHSSQDDTMAVISADSSGVQQENRSYASIVKVPKAAASPASNSRPAPTKSIPNAFGSTNLSPEPAASALTSDNGPEGSNPQEDVEGHSIYIRNLPLNATVASVTEEFAKFGPIKHGGVQVKIHRQYGYYYGFVEFESVDSMQNAIKESPITMGRCHVLVEEKRSTIRVGCSGNTERYTSGRGEFQDSLQGRGYFDGRGHGRSEFRDNHNFSSRPKSNSGRNNDGRAHGQSEFRNNHNFSSRTKSNSGRNTEYRYQRVERSGSVKHGSQAGSI